MIIPNNEIYSLYISNVIRINDLLSKNNYHIHNFYGKCNIIIDKPDNFISLIEKINSANIPDNCNSLYFLKSCKYPRFKLKETKYKRTRDKDKSDIIVLPTFNESYNIVRLNAFEKILIKINNKYFFTIDNENLEKKYFKNIKDEINNLEGNNTLDKIIKFYQKNGVLPEGDIEYFKDYIKTNLDVETLNIMYNNTNKCIIGKGLDKNLSEKYIDINYEMFNSLDNMLSSNDLSSVETAIKMLNGINIHNNKFKISLLIY